MRRGEAIILNISIEGGQLEAINLGAAIIRRNTVFCKQFDRNKHFSPFKLRLAAIEIGAWISSAALNNLGDVKLGNPKLDASKIRTVLAQVLTWDQVLFLFLKRESQRLDLNDSNR